MMRLRVAVRVKDTDSSEVRAEVERRLLALAGPDDDWSEDDEEED